MGAISALRKRDRGLAHGPSNRGCLPGWGMVNGVISNTNPRLMIRRTATCRPISGTQSRRYRRRLNPSIDWTLPNPVFEYF
jgi:hypothetical protein